MNLLQRFDFIVKRKKENVSGINWFDVNVTKKFCYDNITSLKYHHFLGEIIKLAQHKKMWNLQRTSTSKHLSDIFQITSLTNICFDSNVTNS